jgi:hypothetical protein
VYIRSPSLEVLVLPEVGGKIAQIRDLRDGVRRLLVPPQRPYAPLQVGGKWVDYDTSGMDDCFPNVDECPYPHEPWKGVPLPQLGEWVYGAWDVEHYAANTVTLARDGSSLPYRAFKTISVSGATLEVRYRVENRCDAPIHYMWSAHPLLSAGPTFHLELPRPAEFVTYPPDGQTYTWPWYKSLDLSREWIEAGRTLKIFLFGLNEGNCQLTTVDLAVGFEFNVQETPFLGVWFNHFGFQRAERPQFRCIAVEPCTSCSDVLDPVHRPSDRVLEPRSAAAWFVRVISRRIRHGDYDR